MSLLRETLSRPSGSKSGSVVNEVEDQVELLAVGGEAIGRYGEVVLLRKWVVSLYSFLM